MVLDETYVKVAGRWRDVYKAAAEHRVIDVFGSPRRDGAGVRRFFTAAITAPGEPVRTKRLDPLCHKGKRYIAGRLGRDGYI